MTTQTTTDVPAYEVIVLDERTGLYRRDMLKYLGRAAQREVKRLERTGVTAQAVPYLGHGTRMVIRGAA